MAAKAVAFAEVLEFGRDYAKQVIRNARAFAVALNEMGFQVLGESRGFTESHQIAVNVLEFADGGRVEEDLERSRHHSKQAADTGRHQGGQKLPPARRHPDRGVRDHKTGYGRI